MSFWYRSNPNYYYYYWSASLVRSVPVRRSAVRILLRIIIGSDRQSEPIKKTVYASDRRSDPRRLFLIGSDWHRDTVHFIGLGSVFVTLKFSPPKPQVCTRVLLNRHGIVHAYSANYCCSGLA